jgi:ribosomal protein S27AE
MTCPACGSPMNHHADKLEYTDKLDKESEAVDRDLGGLVVEVHTCPGCGNVETRVADGNAGPTRGSVLY